MGGNDSRLGNARVTESTAQMAASRAATDARPSKVRSAVTNGRALFVEGDQRTPWARRYRDLVEQHTADMGGDEAISEAQRSLIRRAATLAILCEQAEGRMSRGDTVDVNEYQTAANALRRILATLGLERRARDATPKTALEYAREMEGAA